MAGKPHPDPEGLFWSRVDKSAGPESCWPWTGYLARNGYGQAYARGLPIKSHRRAFQLANGWLPAGNTRGCLIIRHACDNPRCCNPAHLIAGTHKDNMRDMAERGRRTPSRLIGSRNPAAKLTDDDRRTIKRLRDGGHSQDAIAAIVGVGQSTVSRLLLGRSFAGECAA